MKMMWIKLRGAVYSEKGYCLQAPPLRTGVTAYFSNVDPTTGKATTLDVVAGCEDARENDQDTIINIPLTPYPDAKAAGEALAIMCFHLGDAVTGDAKAREAVAAGWLSMVANGLMLDRQPLHVKTQLIANLYGGGRINDAINKHGTAAYLGDPDMGAMLDEALPIAA